MPCSTPAGAASPRSSRTVPSPIARSMASTTWRSASPSASSHGPLGQGRGSGVMFSIDTETGFPDVVLIAAAWGLGERSSGTVDPDEYMVFKPLLRQGLPAHHRPRRLGGKETKHSLRGDTMEHPTRQAGSTPRRRAAPIRAWMTTRSASWRGGPSSSKNTTPADGHRVGEGRRDGRGVHPPGPPRDGARAAEASLAGDPTSCARNAGRACWRAWP
jgi:hypothetical protein